MRDEAISRIKAIGQHLRTTRQERGEDLYDIADFLRIRPSYLFALEEGDLDAMPGRPYAFGFLRSYSDYLGFDGKAVVDEVRNLLESGLRPDAQLPKKPVESGKPAWSLVTACIILIAAALGGWSVLQGGTGDLAALPEKVGTYVSSLFDNQTGTSDIAESPVTAPVPASDVATAQDPVVTDEETSAPETNVAAATAVPKEPTKVVVRTIERSRAGNDATTPGQTQPPIPLPERLNSAVPRDLVKVEALPEAVVANATAREIPTQSLTRSAPGSANASELSGETASELLGNLRADAGGDAERRTFGAGINEARVILVARESSWIQIKSSERDYIRSRTLEPGDQFALPNRSDLALWTGNAGGLEVVVDGQNLGRLGDRGAVMRDVALAPETLLTDRR